MSCSFDPYHLLPIKLWQIIVAHIDDKSMLKNLEMSSDTLKKLINTGAKVIFEESGIKMPPLLLEYSRLVGNSLDYKSLAIDGNPTLFSFNDVLNKIDEYNQSKCTIDRISVNNVHLTPGEPSVVAVTLKKRPSVPRFRFPSMHYSVYRNGIPSWISLKVRVKCITLSDRAGEAKVYQIEGHNDPISGVNSAVRKIGGPYSIPSPSHPSTRINVYKYEEISTHVRRNSKFPREMATVIPLNSQLHSKVLLLLDFSAEFEIDEEQLRMVIGKRKACQLSS